MRSGAVALAILLSLLLLLSGCNYQQPLGGGPLFKPPETGPPQTDALHKQLNLLGCADVNTLDACNYKQALAAKSRQPCKDISAEELRDTCLEDVGLLAHDREACLSITDAGKLDACLLSLLKAGQANIPCSLLRREENRGWCEKNIANPADEARQKLEPFQLFCLAQPTDALRQPCLQSLAAPVLPETFCDFVPLQEKKEDCLLLLSKHLSTYSLCTQVLDPTKFAACAANKGLFLGSTNACKEIADEALEAECIKDVGVGLASPQACKQLSATRYQSLRFDCLDRVALQLDDPAVCEDVKQRDKRGFCYGKIAEKRKDYALCAKVRNEPLTDKDPFLAPDSCYVYAGERLLAAEACGFVKYAPRKASCQKNVAAGIASSEVLRPPVETGSGPKTCTESGGRVCAAADTCATAVVALVDTYECCLSRCIEANDCVTVADCNDNDPSTLDECRGTPLSCVHTQARACKGGDGLCPADCFYPNDSDCAPDECAQDVDCDTTEKLAQCLKGTCVRSSHPYVCTYAAHPSLIC